MTAARHTEHSEEFWRRKHCAKRLRPPSDDLDGRLIANPWRGAIDRMALLHCGGLLINIPSKD